MAFGLGLVKICLYLDDSPALGDIHTFRMAVWAAHLGGNEAVYENPVTEESLARVKEIIRGFQEVYSAQANLEDTCLVHMMDYPILVNKDGSVEDQPDWETFPDQGGRVAGKMTMKLPPYLTT